jgi:hypothetical protein
MRDLAESKAKGPLPRSFFLFYVISSEYHASQVNRAKSGQILWICDLAKKISRVSSLPCGVVTLVKKFLGVIPGESDTRPASALRDPPGRPWFWEEEVRPNGVYVLRRQLASRPPRHRGGICG